MAGVSSKPTIRCQASSTQKPLGWATANSDQLSIHFTCKNIPWLGKVCFLFKYTTVAFIISSFSILHNLSPFTMRLDIRGLISNCHVQPPPQHLEQFGLSHSSSNSSLIYLAYSTVYAGIKKRFQCTVTCFQAWNPACSPRYSLNPSQPYILLIYINKLWLELVRIFYE